MSAPLSIIGHACSGDSEAIIDGIRVTGRRVDVSLVRADGRPAVARMDLDDWQWLELRHGDIVAVGRRLDPALSG